MILNIKIVFLFIGVFYTLLLSATPLDLNEKELKWISQHPSIVVSNENRIIYNSSSIIKFTKGLNEFTREIILDSKLEPGDYTLLVEAVVGGKVIKSKQQ